MPTPGQPELYNPTYCDLARDYCLAGATNDILADSFGVSRRTIQGWIATQPDFADAVRKGRIVVDARVVRALSSAPRASTEKSPALRATGRKAHHHHHDMASARHPGLRALAA